MITKRKKLLLAMGLALFISSSARAAVIYQWTENGVLHFTDSLSLVPEPVRRSSSLTVREMSDSSSATRPQVATPAVEPPQPGTGPFAEAIPVAFEPLVTVYAPEETTIVVVNSDVRQPIKHPCKLTPHCKPIFRPDFNNRQYIHPSVFNGGSRQYIHPSRFNAGPRPPVGRR